MAVVGNNAVGSLRAAAPRTAAVVRGGELLEKHRAATQVCMRRNTRERVVAARPPRTLARASTPVTRRSGIPNLQCTIV